MFGVKDTIRCKLRTCVVYRFLCADCNACYVGETSQHLSTRVREHLVSDRTSYIFGHLHNSPQCRTLCSDKRFNILDHASRTFQLKIKEAIHIQWEKPTLNPWPTLSCEFETFLANAYIVLLLFFALSNQHFVTHLKFNFVLCIIQNWRWRRSCWIMFFNFNSVVSFSWIC